MELRDYFAGQALAGLLAGKSTSVLTERGELSMYDGAYYIADQAVLARDRTRKPANPYRDPAPEQIDTPEDEVAE